MKFLFACIKYLFIVLVVSTAVGSIVAAGLLMHFSRGLPNIITMEDYKPPIASVVLGKGDVVVGEFYDADTRRYLAPLDKIPEHVVQAFVAAEDDRFFQHQGIDLQGILRAAIANFRAGRVVQGGSTITQQVAKSLLLTPERSFFRKIKEVILANRMEKNLDKKQILHLYLNQIYLGQGAYGVEAAARVYFNKTVTDLTLSEAAVLAGLPQAPSKYTPLGNPKRAKERQLYVLRRMFENGSIRNTQMEEAGQEPLKIHLPQNLNLKYAPYYVEHLRKYLLKKVGAELLYGGGLTIRTPIDPRLSLVAAKAIQEGLRNVDKRQGYRGPIKSNRNAQEVEEALTEATEYNRTRKFPYQLLMADGTYTTSYKSYVGPDRPELDALDEKGIYKGVVALVDDKKKEVVVRLTPDLRGVIPLEHMKWAYPAKNAANGAILAHEITLPSKAVAKGDLIWVRVVTKEPQRTGPGEKATLPVLALEQVPAVQGALLSMDVTTGEVATMVGGFDFAENEFNRAIQALRQPGSAYKPIIYAAAVDKGYSPATIIQDSPIVFDAGEHEKWKPENFEEKFYGDTLFRSALIRSRNVPTIKVVQDIQVPYLIEYSKRLGMTENLNPDLSIALGSSSISLLELSRVYAIFPRGGRLVQPLFITKITDRESRTIEENAPKPNIAPAPDAPLAPVPKLVRVAGELQAELSSGAPDPSRGVWNADPADPDRVMDARTAFVLTHLMNEVATMGTGAEAKNVGRPAAGKTGTTNDFLDAWFMGFTPQMITGVWVGFDAQKSLGPKGTGAQVALPVWLEYMKEAVKDQPVAEFAVPKGVKFVFIDSKTGMPVSANRPNAVQEAFIEGTEPGAVQVSPSVVAGSGGTGSSGVNGPAKDSESSDGVGPAHPTGASEPPPQEFFKEDIE